MPKTKKDVLFFTDVKTTITENGEVVHKEMIKKIKNSDEPQFIKLYVDFVLSSKELSRSLNPVLLAFVSYMTYADTNNSSGGQVIYINKAMKDDICEKLNIKIDRVNQSLMQFKKAGIFKALAKGKYQVNPNYFGRGEWRDIKQIKGTFNYSKNGVEIYADVQRNESESQTETVI